MTAAAGLVLALASAFALNWGWLDQHGAARELPDALARPPRSTRCACSSATARWLVGFLVGLAGWVFYVAALDARAAFARAGHLGRRGRLARGARTPPRRRDPTADWSGAAAAVLGLVLIAVSLAGGATSATRPAPGSARRSGCVVSRGALAALTFTRRAGIASGTLYAAGDVATKAAVFGGAWLGLVPVILAAHGLAFVALQLGFQRGDALETAGTASLLTNALPIAAGLVLFDERLPSGALGTVRLVGFVLVIGAAGLLARDRGLTVAPA